MLTALLFTLFAASPLLCVHAQSSATPVSSAVASPMASLPPCVLNCTTTAITQAGCTGLNDISCFCTSTKFQTVALACLQANCSASDQASAVGLQSSLCASVNSSTSSSVAASSSATAPGSATSSAAATSSSGTASSNAASGLTVGLGMGHVIGFIVVLGATIAGTLS
ncbi:hypothetical protein JB92DRAFT_914737 [Gautieria morchelliformis]|nr:hypothetical protein JB92DRAFT_914737 [Gautieria morchelliformis]